MKRKQYVYYCTSNGKEVWENLTRFGENSTFPSGKKKKVWLFFSNSYYAVPYFMDTSTFQSKMIKILALPSSQKLWSNDKRHLQPGAISVFGPNTPSYMGRLCFSVKVIYLLNVQRASNFDFFIIMIYFNKKCCDII